ncbi:Oidioi.mRNA.OKI2018_I69.chr2.g6901.t1.cds [Oikopleura dioica]|uniref:Oidioi.mRNA.OKI2018_I69.chr2.g6901.t1.cds n=1 Tax=Oikopleura dioica TaxID=34765 RepID=A0ABN7T9A3_OIKDI|nr:Oidioi.mRNA.OKI2018_I69.chr2.g6901.t1.cds [Oikopleura dioica]
MADKSKNTLYVSGGYTESPKSSSSKVYKLEFENNKPIGNWLEAGSMKLARDSHAMVAWNDGLVIFGKYETNSDRWEYFNEDASRSEFLDIPPVARLHFSYVLASPTFII